MTKTAKQVVAVFLTMAMVIALLPVLGMQKAYAETSSEGLWKYTVSDNAATLTGYRGSDEDITIPSTIDGYTVTAIGDEAFYSDKSKNIKSIHLPETIKSIGNRAFYLCKGLTNISIPDSVMSIGTEGFAYCESLESIMLPDGIEVINEKTFDYCEKLRSISIPDSVKRIEQKAFEGCIGLTEITFGNGLETIGADAFVVCESLSTVRLPDSVASIGKCAFYQCTNLKSITFSDRLETIGGSAFALCKNLEEVTIPKSAKMIDASAFESCSALKKITLPEGMESIGENAFFGCGLELIVYGGTKAAWAALIEENQYYLEDVDVVCLKEDSKILIGNADITGLGKVTYTGKPITPVIDVRIDGKTLDRENYTVVYKNNTNAGIAAVVITGKGNYTGTIERTFTIAPSKVNVPSGKTLTYNGKAQTGVISGKNYTVENGSKTKAGAYTAKITLKDKTNYAWPDGTTTDKKVGWRINKASNQLTIKAKTATVKYKKLKKAEQTLAVSKVITFTKKGQGKMTYTKVSGNKKITIDKKTGKVMVKKGLKRGTYKVKVKLKAAGNANYKASAVKTVTFKVKVN